MKTILGVAAMALLCGAPALAQPAPPPARPTHVFLSVAMAPDGRHVASIEGDAAPSGAVDIQSVVIRDVPGGTAHPVTLPCGKVAECTPDSLAWSADGRSLAFTLRSPGTHSHSIETVGTGGGATQRRLAFDGTLTDLRLGPGDRLAVLATAGAVKESGALQAGAAITGELGAQVPEQRIAILGEDGALHFASPPDLFVYEYDWLPDGSGFVGTAAPGDGDDHWWVARLWRFGTDGGAGRVIHAPDSARQQLAMPRVSPDGRFVSFIGGLMSDFVSTGGEAFVVPAEGGPARNLTPGAPLTIEALRWDCGGGLIAAALAGGETRLLGIPAQGGASQTRSSTAATQFSGGDGALPSLACGPGQAAAVAQDFTHGPEIVTGAPEHLAPLTSANAGLSAPATVRSLEWRQDGYRSQGFLLLPPGEAPAQGWPMVTLVHGGPAAANRPAFLGEGIERSLLEAGFALLLPNPRGSFGQGEAFTAANVRDFGHGDLDDILAGVDAALAAAPIDAHRLGIGGWSYGGYMTMWAVTQTQRFAAAFAGAGIADWQSYYGQNGIDAWMIPYFGASVYDDPNIYARSSPITFIRQVRTPTFMAVGERDVECPAAQTQEYWHALQALGVPTGAVIYPDEGHWVQKRENVADLEARAVRWFRRWLGGAR